MTDLFHRNTTFEDDLAVKMTEQVERDIATIMAQGRVPPWVELDSILQKDEYRLLDLIESHFGYPEGGDITKAYGVDDSGLFPVEIVRRVDNLTDDAGFIAMGNATAVVNRCIANGWIERKYDPIEKVSKLHLTQKGRWCKDMADTDRYWDEMED